MNSMTTISCASAEECLPWQKKLQIQWFKRLMSKRSNVYQSLIWVDQLCPHGFNDLSIQKCKNQIFPLHIFSQYNWGSDFQNMLSFKVICDFLIWVNPVGLSLVIFYFGFQSREGLHRNMVMLLIVGLHGSKGPSVFLQCDHKVLFFHGPNEVS